MIKKIKIIAGILVAVLFVAVGGYFLASRFGKMPSGKVVYVQPTVTSLAQPNTSNIQQEADSSQDTSNNQPLATNGQAGSNNTSQVTSDPDSSQQASSTQSASTSGAAKIVARFVTWGFQQSSGRTIDTIIIHSSYDATGSDPFNVDGVIAEWKALGVSPHYLIARDGTIYQLVADQDIAYHAGESKMPAPDNRTNVNDFSIGIEMINTLTGKFTDAQYSSLNSLIANLKAKYPIKNVLGHYQISPGRKTDPWNIDWGKVNK